QLRRVEGPDARDLKARTGAEREHVRRHVQAVRPDAELRIVIEVVANLDRIEVPAAGQRVATLRRGETLVRRREDVAANIGQEGEVGDDPAVFERVIDDDRIAKVVRVAEVSEVALAHERVEGEGRFLETVGFSEDADRGVNRLNVVSR